MSKVGKTNKSFAKRLRVTKNGKVMARRPGQNHFNAKKSRRSLLAKKRTSYLDLSKKQLSNILPNN